MFGDSFQLEQFDTYAPNLQASKIRITEPYAQNYNQMFYHQLTPNGEIYIAGHNSPTPISVIHYPDSAGLACGLDTFSFNPYFGYVSFGMPCFPHYRTPPNAAYAAEAGRDTTVCDSLLQLSVGIPLGAPGVDSIVYAWSSPNDANFGGSTQAQIIVQPNASAMYILHIQDTSTTPKYSCTERWDTVRVEVIQNCFTDIRHKTQDTRRIQVSPNPANEFVVVSVDRSLVGGEMRVTDATGKTVAAVQLLTENSKLETARWASGVYSYNLVKNGVAVERGKFVVTH